MYVCVREREIITWYQFPFLSFASIISPIDNCCLHKRSSEIDNPVISSKFLSNLGSEIITVGVSGTELKVSIFVPYFATLEVSSRLNHSDTPKLMKLDFYF